MLFLYFKFIPMITGLVMSFHEIRYIGTTWVGFDNYAAILSDDAFLTAIWHSAVLAIGTTVGSLVLGFCSRAAHRGPARHLWFVRTAVFLPGRDHDGGRGRGVADHVLPRRHRPAQHHPRLGRPRPAAVPGNSADTSLLSIMGVGIWRGTPYDMMIFLAGLAGVDRTLYEAAAVDGAGRLAPAVAHHVARAAPGVRDPVHPRRDPRPAGVHRDLPAHQRRPERLHRGGR